MSRNIIRPVANVAIAFAVVFFLYGLVRIVVELPPEERVQAIATILVVTIVLGSLGWIFSAMRPGNRD